MEIDYNLFVDKYYQMDPSQEDLLFDGTELRDGMIVLVDSFETREEIRYDGSLDGHKLEQALRWNRWMIVSHVRREDDQLQFMAEYSDGSKKKIRVPIDHSWVVAKSSIPVEDFGLPIVERAELEKVVGTAKVVDDPRTGGVQLVAEIHEPPKAWVTGNSSFSGGDQDLVEDGAPKKLPYREPGMLFNEVHEKWVQEHASTE